MNHKLMKVIAGATLFSICLVLPMIPAAAGPPADTGHSLRVLNWNLGFLWADLPGVCGSIDINDGKFGGYDYPTRAGKIADAILATDNDVVVLNEVFSPDVQKALVSKLSATYPSYISSIHKTRKVTIANALLSIILGPVSVPCQDFLSLSQTTDIEATDSGLMIFVKKGLQFAPFSPDGNPPYDVTTVKGSNMGAPWGAKGQIAVDTFEFSPDLGILEEGECYLDDCFATKAAAMVRVLNPVTNMVSNIAFSHTQAWNDPPQVATREEQFKIMSRLITASLTKNELTRQPVYVTGDLNVPGQNKANGKAGSEWTKIFNSGNSSSGQFYACGLGPCGFNPTTLAGSLLTDSWGFETSTADDGITNVDDGARLDYFLHNLNLPGTFNDMKFCLQHVMRGYELEGGDVLSDHRGVRADVNRRAPHCSANDDAGQFGPKPILLDGNGNFSFGGSIQFKGGMQWLKLGKETGWGTGSYVFSASPNVDFDVYESTDLSDPISMFSKDPSGRSVKYVLPDRPYYIRVFAKNQSTGKPDRTLTGNYGFTVHENRGITPGDAIAMKPGVPNPYPWPMIPLNQNSVQKDNVTFKPDTEIWQEFLTDTGTAGTFPAVEFLTENSVGLAGPNTPFSLKLRSDSNGQPVLADVMDQDQDGDWDQDGAVDFRLEAPDLPGSGSGPKRYFLTMTRNAPADLSDITSFTTFRTDLTYIKSIKMVIHEEVTWGPAADSSKFQWAYDVAPTPSCVSVNGATCYGPVELDDGYHWPTQHPSFQGSFVDQMQPRIWEDGDLLEPYWGSSPITTVNMGEPAVQKHTTYWDSFIWANAGNEDDADYWYSFRYCLGHWPGDVQDCKL